MVMIIYKSIPQMKNERIFKQKRIANENLTNRTYCQQCLTNKQVKGRDENPIRFEIPKMSTKDSLESS